jgi:hypothetical protein
LDSNLPRTISLVRVWEALITVAKSSTSLELLSVVEVVLILSLIGDDVAVKNCGYRVSKSLTLAIAPHRR